MFSNRVRTARNAVLRAVPLELLGGGSRHAESVREREPRLPVEERREPLRRVARERVPALFAGAHDLVSVLEHLGPALRAPDFHDYLLSST